MKKTYSMALIILAFSVNYSCSNNDHTPATNQAPTAPSSDLLKEVHTYDKNKIDPKAPLVELNLHAQGNSMADMHYDQKELHVASGSTVKLNFVNDGTDNSMLHNFVLIEEGAADTVAHSGLKVGPDMNYVPDMPQVLVSTKVLQPKAKTEITFPAPDKGTYDFICTYPGHYLKMNGKFIVD